MSVMNNAFALLSEFAYKLRYEDIKAHDREYMKLLISDYYAAIMAGYRINTSLNVPLLKVIMDMGGKEESSVIFSEKRIPASNAALVHGCYAMGAELDDGHRRANGHPASTIMSSVFALAETMDVTEQDVLTAIAAGYEFLCRLASATQPGQLRRGFHVTGMTGTIASAAACTKLLGLGLESFHRTIAAAVIQANGMMTIPTLKPLSPGGAAQAAVLTAQLIRHGAGLGDANGLDRSTKWFTAVSDVFNESEITDGLGKTLRISQCYIKPYPACRHIHAAIDAALTMRKEFNPFKAERIIISVYKGAWGMATRTRHPLTSADAKFSTAYAVATAFVFGRFSLEDLNVDKIDPRVDELANKFEFVLDESLEDRAAGIRGAKMEMVIDGVSHELMLPLPKGDPENPVTLQEVRAKMGECAGDLLSADEVDEVFAKATALGSGDQFKAIRILRKR